MFDLVIKNGTVIDPARGLEAAMDVAISGGKIAAVESGIPESGAVRIVDASGRLVLPGLIDIHAHVYPGVTTLGADPDEFCLKRGTTTVLDAGSAGSHNFPGLKKHVIDSARTRVYALVHLSCLGLSGVPLAGELSNHAYADPDGAVETLKRYPESALGVKVRLTEGRAVAGPGLPVLKLARDVADRSGKMLMSHIGDSVEPLAEILPLMRSGDIITHIATGMTSGALDERGRVIPELWDARSRGVLFDIAPGRNNFSFRVAEAMLDQGFPPDTIGSDLTISSTSGPVYDLPTVMSRFLLLGVPLMDVIRAATEAPARALGKVDEIGSLEIGRTADVSILQWVDGDFPIVDTTGDTRVMKRRLAPFVTVRAGEVV